MIFFSQGDEKMKRKIFLVIIIIFTSIGTYSLSHSGRTDGYGGHYNRSTGTYHYHDGSYSGEYTAPVEEGGVRIDEVVEDEDELTVNKNDTRDINSIIDENDRLKTEVEAKRNSLTEAQEKIKEQEERITELEDSKIWIHIIYIVIIILMLIYGYKHLE